MKEHVMRKWVKALRYGGYEQGTGVLVNKRDEFCCLGVLCNIAPDSTGGWVVQNLGGATSWTFEGSDGRHNDAHLPKSVQSWAGMATNSGAIPGLSLVDLNDSEGWKLNRIADYIERHWREL